jgi:translation initiation factor RLI1
LLPNTSATDIKSEAIMTIEEKQAFTDMQHDVQALVKQQADLNLNQQENSRKLDEVLTLLKGDGFGNEGFVRRVIGLETDIKVLKESKAINGVYIKIITWLLAIIATGVVGFILDTILKK